MRQMIQRFLRDRRGNITIMSALCMMLLLGFAAFGVDFGSIFLDKRKTQSTADLAAIVAASDLAHANLAAVEPGVYIASAALAPVGLGQADAWVTASAAMMPCW
jgi:uncharacterized membrane protein